LGLIDLDQADEMLLGIILETFGRFLEIFMISWPWDAVF
jgi:hypothetical protein